MELTFKATIKIRGVNPYVLVSQARAAKLKQGWHRPMPVLVTVNGQPPKPWHINMMPIGDGSFYLYLHGDVRKISGTGTGDKVTIGLSFDPDYTPGPDSFMPDWFERALNKQPVAKQNWEKLSPSRQKEIARYLASLKGDDARKRNLAKTLQMLDGSAGRFMGRSWKDGA